MADGVVTVEAMSRRRREILSGSLVFGGLWQLTRIIGDLTTNSRLLHPWWALLWIVQMAGWFGWGVLMFRMNSFTKRLRENPAVAEAVGDEFYQQVRLKSFALACGAAMACQAGLLAVSVFHPLTARAGADITIFVTYTTALGAFLRLDQA